MLAANSDLDGESERFGTFGGQITQVGPVWRIDFGAQSWAFDILGLFAWLSAASIGAESIVQMRL